MTTFLERVANTVSDQMPDSSKTHFSFYRKRDVFQAFLLDYTRLFKYTPPTSCFLSVWKTHCWLVRVRRVRRFVKCSVCEEIDAALKETLLRSLDVTPLRQKWIFHTELICREQIEYYKKRDLERLYPNQCCSIIFYGADQSALGLPHYVTSTNGQRVHALKVKLAGILEHKKKSF